MPPPILRSGSRLEVKADFFGLRTPLLPITEFWDWGRGLESHARISEEDDFASAYAKDILTLRSRLKELLSRPAILQALWIASPDLSESLGYWFRDPDSKKGRNVEQTLFRYFCRMTGRCTPFGLFAGHSVGQFGAYPDGGPVRLDSLAAYKTATRLDFDYLFALATALQNDPAIRDDLRFTVNSTLRSVGDALHYIEARQVDGGRSYHLVRLYRDPCLDSLVLRARAGATIAELVSGLMEDFPGDGFSEAELVDYVREAVDANILFSGLVPHLTGNSASQEFLSMIEAIPSAATVAGQVRTAIESISGLDLRSIGTPPVDYQEIHKALPTVARPVSAGRVFQVDLLKPLAQPGLDSHVCDLFAYAAELIVRAGEAPPQSPELQRFITDFIDRYEQAWVPIEDVLDDDSGIGFGRKHDNDGSPLLRGLAARESQHSRPPTAFQELVLSKIRASSLDRREVLLSDDDFPPLKLEEARLPSAFFVAGSVYYVGNTGVAGPTPRVFVHGGGGPSGASLLGRFAHTDPGLCEYVTRHLEDEAAHNPEVIFAEVVHVPEGRLGNIAFRPVLRRYEITYLARSGAAEDFQIPVRDLLVGVRNGKVFLWSKRLGKLIVPRMTNAHGFTNSRLLPLYRFLCTLQIQDGEFRFINFRPFSGLDFFPRISVGDVTLAFAHWKLDVKAVRDFVNLPDRDAFRHAQRLREERAIPRTVRLGTGETAVPIDFTNPFSVAHLKDILKKGQAPAILFENCPASSSSGVEGPEGEFWHEMIVPFVRQSEKTRIPHNAATSASAAYPLPHALNLEAQPAYPGEAYLYVKIYAGPAILEDALLHVIRPRLETLFQEGYIAKWFFIRYSDPQHHLRLRLVGDRDSLNRHAWPAVKEALHPYCSRNQIWKIQIDTYAPEVERYGGTHGIIVAEDIFAADSQAIVDLLHVEVDNSNRWMVGLKSIDAMLGDFELSLADRVRMSTKGRDLFFERFNYNVGDKRAMDNRFRSNRKCATAALTEGVESHYPGAAQILKERSRKIRASYSELYSLAQSGRLQANPLDLLSSFVHMSTNRLMRTSAVQHEYVLYDFLSRIYESFAAIERNRSREAREREIQEVHS